MDELARRRCKERESQGTAECCGTIRTLRGRQTDQVQVRQQGSLALRDERSGWRCGLQEKALCSPSHAVDCGAVVAVNALYEGDWNRNFEGEEDNSQCGAAADPNMLHCRVRLIARSDAFNLKTLLVSSTGKNSHLQHKQSTIEMNLSKVLIPCSIECRLDVKTRRRARNTRTRRSLSPITTWSASCEIWI